MHDINLPLIGDFPVWGSKHLFDALTLKKQTDETSDPPNIGSVVIPRDKAALEEELRGIIDAREWEAKVPEKFTRPLLGVADSESA